MNYDDYITLALRTAKPLPTKADDLRHSAIGLVTELGELATIIKRISIYGKPLDAKMCSDAEEELGDVEWYIAIGLNAIGSIDDFLASASGYRPAPASMKVSDAILMCASRAGMVCELSISEHLTQPLRGRAEALLFELAIILDTFIAPHFGTTGPIARARNVAKLRERFPEAYTDADAEARADKGGADARSS